MTEAIIALGVRSAEIFRVTLDGAVTTLRRGAPGESPDGVVVLGDRMYWTTMGRPVVDPDNPGEAGLDYSARNGGIHSANLDGTDVRHLTAPGDITTGKQLATDGTRLYWGDREGCRVSRIDLDGSGLTELVINQPQPDRRAECVGVAVDPSRGYLYWSQKGPAKGGRGRILRAGLDLPAGETADNRTDIEVLWDGLPEPIDLDIVGDTLYWTDRGAAPNGNSLNRSPIPAAGAAGSEPEVLATGFHEAIGLIVDEQHDIAYVSDLGGAIHRVVLSTGDVALLADLGTPISGITRA